MDKRTYTLVPLVPSCAVVADEDVDSLILNDVEA
jgi:hypothetical protein